MTNTNPLQQHLAEKFINYSTSELVILNNELVNSKWGQNKSTFRSALLSALSRRGIDLSAIISKEEGFTLIQLVKVKLENNRLIPVH